MTMMDIDRGKLKKTLDNFTEKLLDSRTPAGYWQGRLSSSALSTATAVFALALVDKTSYRAYIKRGLDWLTANQNADGGWGDTILSSSNISTTMLCRAAFAAADDSDAVRQTVSKAENWLARRAGSLKPGALAGAVSGKYGGDRTFSVPILTMCALAGKLGDKDISWKLIKPLPFEFAACPRRLLKLFRLSVVSYALPALIAVGQAHYHHKRPANPVTAMLRGLTRKKALRVLTDIQPADGGFLEAPPLTAFVVMCLVSIGQKGSVVVSKGTAFLLGSVRDDGSWPIDVNLAAWVTTLSVNALACSRSFRELLGPDERAAIRDWLLDRQYHRVHPYTLASPGGWAWTDLPGGVPDADDTAGALVALHNLDLLDAEVIAAVEAAVGWLAGLQNSDGGIPTFCRGWTKLPFDRSAADLTAHAITALARWREMLNPKLQRRIDRTTQKALIYLRNNQRRDGCWLPLWFGCEPAPQRQNPVYGTAKVISALCGSAARFGTSIRPMLEKAVRWLLSAQNADGGWGGAPAVESSIEQTALAVDALAALRTIRAGRRDVKMKSNTAAREIESAICKGTEWLIERTNTGQTYTPSPIGLYFAKLWYYERLYPLVFSVSALSKAYNLINRQIPANI